MAWFSVVLLVQDSFGRSDPFLRIGRLNPDSSVLPVLKTEVVMNNLSPKWRPIAISLQKLCNGNVHRPLKVR